MESSVDDLVEMLKSPLTEGELEKMMPDNDNTSQPQEPDAYSAFLNHYTNRNTEALVKCESTVYFTKPLLLDVSIPLNKGL